MALEMWSLQNKMTLACRDESQIIQKNIFSKLQDQVLYLHLAPPKANPINIFETVFLHNFY